jgi:type I restriction enzyme S subunit
LLGIVAPDFVSYFLRSPHGQKQLGSYAGGSVQQVLNLVDLRKVLVPVPPLPEQQRIVALLDEALAGLATAKANAERSLRNARAVFESHLAVTFSRRGDGWAEMSLDEVVDPSCTLSYGIVQPGEDHLDGLPVVRPTDMAEKVICLEGLKRIDPRLAEGYRRTTLQGGELLLCVRGSTGVVSIAAPELRGANVTRGIVPVRFNSAYVLPELGYYLMKSEHVQSQIREKTYGAALMQINIRDLRAITLFVPSLKEQSVMALTLSGLDTEVQRLTQIYERKLAALEELKKSLLQQAFNGEL